jgi:hypothetical protein
MRSDQRNAFLSLRALALSLGPDVVERVEGSEASYARRARIFAVLRAGRGTPALIFPHDVPLSDPMGRLQRRGEERFLPLDGDLDGHVQQFVRNAYAAMR